VSEIWARFRDPWLSTVMALVVVGAVGAGLIIAGYRGVAPELLVPFQVPFLFSASLLGLCLVGSACVLVAVHLERVESAEERRALSELQREALRLLALATPAERD
jgi:hypothetical protein